MSTLANLMVNIDPKAVEAARVAVIKATEASESAYGRWVKAAEAVKAAWPAQGMVDRVVLTEWIVSALPKSDQEILSAEVGTVDAKARKAAQSKVSKYIDRMLERAYPPAVVVQPAPELTPEQKAAQAAKVEAAQANVEKAAAIKAESDAAQAAKAAKLEAEAAAIKAKAAQAAAELDESQAEAAMQAAAEAEELKAQAEAAKVEAEAAKVEAEAAKAAAIKAQADANAKAAAIHKAKKVAQIVDDLDALIARVKGYAESIEGSEDLEAGLIGLRVDFQRDNDLI